MPLRAPRASAKRVRLCGSVCAGRLRELGGAASQLHMLACCAGVHVCRRCCVLQQQLKPLRGSLRALARLWSVWIRCAAPQLQSMCTCFTLQACSMCLSMGLYGGRRGQGSMQLLPRKTGPRAASRGYLEGVHVQRMVRSLVQGACPARTTRVDTEGRLSSGGALPSARRQCTAERGSG